MGGNQLQKRNPSMCKYLQGGWAGAWSQGKSHRSVLDQAVAGPPISCPPPPGTQGMQWGLVRP